jgi:hypothetical protein
MTESLYADIPIADKVKARLSQLIAIQTVVQENFNDEAEIGRLVKQLIVRNPYDRAGR